MNQHKEENMRQKTTELQFGFLLKKILSTIP
jgi:hypothetical protein